MNILLQFNEILLQVVNIFENSDTTLANSGIFFASEVFAVMSAPVIQAHICPLVTTTTLGQTL